MHRITTDWLWMENEDSCILICLVAFENSFFLSGRKAYT